MSISFYKYLPNEGVRVIVEEDPTGGGCKHKVNHIVGAQHEVSVNVELKFQFNAKPSGPGVKAVIEQFMERHGIK